MPEGRTLRLTLVAVACLISLLLGLALAFAIDGDSDEETVTVMALGTSPHTGTSETETPEKIEEPAQSALQVWLVAGERLELRHRLLPDRGAPARAVLLELLAGPGADSVLLSALPPKTTLRGLDIKDGGATVDLSSDFTSGGGSLSMRLRVAQVVYTLTQFPTVERVAFAIDGQPVKAIGGEGVAVPASRADFEDLLPEIVVESPYPKERVSSSFRVSGSADVFEANVTLVVSDQSGKQLLRTFTTATCGTGCRGSYDATLRLPAETPAGLLTLSVEDDDADGNGSPQHQVQLLVDFAP